MAVGIAPHKATSFITIHSVFLFVAAFAATWGPIVWTYCSEIFPQKHRSRRRTCSCKAASCQVVALSPLV